MTEQFEPSKKRVITAAACLQCQKRKCKCDGSRPACQPCIDRGVICKFEVPEGMLQKDRIKHEYGTMVTELNDLKALVDALMCSEGNMRTNILARLREGESIQNILQSVQPPSLPDQPLFTTPNFSENYQSSSTLANARPFSPPPIPTFEQGNGSSVSGISESNKTTSHTPAKQPIMDLNTDLSAQLARCGLSQYSETLVQNGFDTWDSLLHIQESDLEALHFKLGHRRKLQRQIFGCHDEATTLQSSPSTEDNPIEDLNSLPLLGRKYGPSTSDTLLRREYKRRPKADVNAPQKPQSAYTSFSNQARMKPELATMTFIAFTKYIGHAWQSLGSDGREIWENLAANRKLAYMNRLGIYKQSEDYKTYQAYLENFKQKKQQVASIYKGNDGAKEQKASDKKVGSGSSDALPGSSENSQHVVPRTDGTEYTNQSELRIAPTLGSQIHHSSPPLPQCSAVDSLLEDHINIDHPESAERITEINGMTMATFDNCDNYGAQFDDYSTFFTKSQIYETDQSMDSTVAYSQPGYTYQPLIPDYMLTQPFNASHDPSFNASFGVGDI